jgi:predicted phosphohydrolase
MTSVDIISDLHQDYWDLRLNFAHPSTGHRHHAPFTLNPTPGTDILIVAGDVSDDIGITLEYLRYWKSKYKFVLFVDGVKEHTHKMFSTGDIGKEMRKRLYKGIYHIPSRPFIINRIAVIGVSGWWNYHGNRNTNDSAGLKIQIIRRASNEYAYLKQMLYHLEINKNIERVVVITHAVPTKSCTQPEKIGRQLNGLLQEIIDSGYYKKLTHWVFGNTHVPHDKVEKGIRLLCNPRGKPTDFGRVEYKQLNVTIE